MLQTSDTRRWDALALLTLVVLVGLAALAPKARVDNSPTAWFPSRDPRLGSYRDLGRWFRAGPQPAPSESEPQGDDDGAWDDGDPSPPAPTPSAPSSPAPSSPAPTPSPSPAAPASEDEGAADEVILVELRGGDLPGLLRLTGEVERELAADREVERVIGPCSAFPAAIRTLADPELGGLKNLPTVGWILQGPLNRTLELVDARKPEARVAALLSPGLASEREALAGRLRALRARAEADGRELRVAGHPLVNLELDRAGREVEEQAMPVLVLACVALLLALTRSPRRVAILLGPVGLSVFATQGLLGLSGVTSNLVVTVASPLVFVLLLATGCHVVIAADERRRAGQDRRTAAWDAARAKGPACLLAIATTAVGFGSLAVSEVVPIRTLGWLSAAGLLLGAPALLVLLPALLSRLDVPDVSLSATLSKPSRLGGLTAWLVRIAQRAWPAILIGALIAIGAGFACARGLKTQPHAIRYLRPQHPLRLDHEALERGGVPLAQLEAVVSGPRDLSADPALLRRLDAWARACAHEPGVRGCVSLPLLLREAGWRSARVEDFPADSLLPQVLRDRAADFAPYRSADGRRLRFSFLIDSLDADGLDALRDRLTTRFQQALGPGHGPDGLELLLTGSYDLLLRTQRSLLDTLISSLLITAALMQGVLILALRSLRLGLAALLPNALPVAAVLGTMVTCGIALDVGTSMCAAIALGIAVDDTLHLLSAARHEGMEQAARGAARAVVLSSVVIAAGFLSITTSSFLPTRSFGLLCATAMGAALIGDLLVLPACLAAMGATPQAPLAPEDSPPDGPAPDGPASDGPAPDGPGSDGPGSDGPGSDGPGSDGPASDGPGSDGPGSDGPGSDGPGSDGPASDVPGSDGPASDVPGSDVPGSDGPGSDGPGSDGPASDGPAPVSA
ncbi:MAG: MMPL family transporter [Planctomycetota bacterium]